MAFKFNSLANGLPDSKEELRRLCFYAHAQFLAEDNEVTVCRPGVAQGAEFSRNQHPKNGLMGVTAPSQFG